MTNTLPVFIIHYRAPNWLKQSILAICSSDVPIRLHVIDNSPPTEVQLPYPVRFIATDENAGFAGAANIALREWLRTEGEYCIIGSHDFIPRPDTFRELIAAAESHKQYGILGPAFDGWSVADQAGKSAIYEQPIHGGGMLLRRSAVLEVGGFDEDFGSYCEDEEFCVRLNAHGWLTGVALKAHARDLGSASPRRNRLAYGNMLLLAYKTLGWKRVMLGIGSHIKRGSLAAASRDWPEARDRLFGLFRGLRSLYRLGLGKGVGPPSF